MDFEVQERPPSPPKKLCCFVFVVALPLSPVLMNMSICCDFGEQMAVEMYFLLVFVLDEMILEKFD